MMMLVASEEDVHNVLGSAIGWKLREVDVHHDEAPWVDLGMEREQGHR